MQSRKGLVRAAALAGDMPPKDYTAEDRYRDFILTFRENPAGRRVLSQLVARCHVVDRSFVPGDTHETSRREGMRDIGLWLLDILEIDPAGSTASTTQDGENEFR